MKTNELMLGDWVLVERYEGIYGGPVWKQAGKVNGIFQEEAEIRFSDDDDDDEFIYSYPSDGIEPIPLTPEILEKNGFEKNKFVKSFSEYVLRKGESEIIVATGEIEEMWIRRTLAERAYCLPYPKYVHQLQHALRLVGIEKEIEL